MSCLGGFGLVSLMDSTANFYQSGLPVFYRTANFDAQAIGSAVSEFGLTVSIPVSGAMAGTTDTAICPQPGVRPLTIKQLADVQKAGANLRAGARVFTVSHSWVVKIQTANGWVNPRQVFNDKSVIGFYHDGLLFELASFVHNDMWGQIIEWDVIGNANEIK